MTDTDMLRCPKCSVMVPAGCKCGLDYTYVPAKVAARNAIQADPYRSDRAIAAATGIGNATISRVRRELYSTSEKGACPTVPNDTVERAPKTPVPIEKRVGLDGKERRMPKPKEKAPARSTDQLPAVRPTSLEQRIEKLERTYKRILEIRKRGTVPHQFYRSVWALLHQPENVSEAKLHQLREEWETYGWLLASEATLPTPSLTDAGIPVKEKVR